MIRKLYKTEQGAVVAEFALSLLVLLPLLLWTFRFADLINMDHKAIEASRFATWERAYGREEADINNRINQFVTKSTMTMEPSGIVVRSDISENSSIDVFKVFPIPGVIYPVSGVSDALGLGHNNYYTNRLQIKGNMFGGIGYTIERKYALITDPWHLVDQDGDNQITDADLKETVDRIYFYVPIQIGGLNIGKAFSSVIKTILDLGNTITNNPFTDFLEFLTTLKFDYDPRGYPTLGQVPKPSK